MGTRKEKETELWRNKRRNNLHITESRVDRLPNLNRQTGQCSVPALCANHVSGKRTSDLAA